MFVTNFLPLSISASERIAFFTKGDSTDWRRKLPHPWKHYGPRARQHAALVPTSLCCVKQFNTTSECFKATVPILPSVSSAAITIVLSRGRTSKGGQPPWTAMGGLQKVDGLPGKGGRPPWNEKAKSTCRQVCKLKNAQTQRKHQEDPLFKTEDLTTCLFVLLRNIFA